MRCTVRAVLVFATALACAPVLHAQQDAWAFDPQALMAGGIELIRRTPDRELDGLLAAVHGAAQSPQEAAAMCALFDPQARRDLGALQATAARLGPQSRERFANAVADVLVAAVQSPPQPVDPVLGRQALKSAGASAAIRHEEFLAGLQADGGDDTARATRCRSLRWLLDGLQSRPLPERAAAMRLLLEEGAARVALPAP